MSEIQGKSKKELKAQKLESKVRENCQIEQSDSEDPVIENQQFTLQLKDPKKRVKVGKFKGKVTIHFRQYYQKEGEWLPSSKGMAISQTQWQFIKKNMGVIDKAIKKIQ